MSESFPLQDCNEDNFRQHALKEAMELLNVLKNQQVELKRVQDSIGGMLENTEILVNKLQSDKENITNKNKSKNEVHRTIENLFNMLKPEARPELIRNIACILKEFDEDVSEFCANIIFKKSLNDHWFLHEQIGVQLWINFREKNFFEIYVREREHERSTCKIDKQLIDLLQENFDTIFFKPKTCGTVDIENKKIARTVITLVGQLFNNDRLSESLLNTLLSELINVKSHLSVQCIFDLLIVVSTGPRSKHFKLTEENKKNLELLQKDSHLQEDDKLLVIHSRALYNKM
ncbi:uncharacterized protein LOC126885874 [Diabrotica virgifera virgifera]|uniref:Uncharacterized protein LOC114332444 n=1 Tax=Diabrotica virgifera virgifera TaxID=50390 RepID=A0A6P7FTD0_DIAVI|nr:uncharacterized protein LOC126885874 [Diabrotica virgifera virgifera]